MTVRKRCPWRGIFNNKNELLGFIEKHEDGWHIFIDRRDVGTVNSPGAAQELIERIQRGESLDG